MADVAGLAQALDSAARDARAIAQLGGELSLADAYAIQALAVGQRLERGERSIGLKLGFTSRAKMLQMGVQDQIWGRLTDGMLVEEGSSVDLKRYIHPRVEPELAFLLGAPLAGIVTPLQARAALEAVAPALEIIDSRYENFKFSLSDVIADNASSAGVVIGPWAAQDVDLGNLGMVMSFNGEVAQAGSSAAILGHPLRALITAARLIGERGGRLEAGDIVLAGAATSAEPLRVGLHVRLEVQMLGAAEFAVHA